jgi:hypothetical protein
MVGLGFDCRCRYRDWISQTKSLEFNGEKETKSIRKKRGLIYPRW